MRLMCGGYLFVLLSNETFFDVSWTFSTVCVRDGSLLFCAGLRDRVARRPLAPADAPLENSLPKQVGGSPWTAFGIGAPL